MATTVNPIPNVQQQIIFSKLTIEIKNQLQANLE